MILPKFKIQTILISTISAIASLSGFVSYAIAQTNIPTCASPSPGEYLLLVISPSKDNQAQLQRVLPNNLKTTVCRYLEDTVTRITGFDKIDDANRWARYIRDSAGLSAIITTRPTAPIAAPITPNVQTVSYKPQQLGQGYAVLVDYFNRPQLVSSVQKVVEGDVGFVSYGQRPYLLATYTTNEKEAYNTLKKLSAQGYFASVVDSSKVMMLRSVVKLP